MNHIKQQMNQRLIGMIVFGLLVFCSTAQSAENSQDTPWIKNEMSIDGSAQIYLNNTFGTKKGKFKAMPDSMLDTRDSIEGTYIVASYRYVYKRPIREGNGAQVDEMISTELLDCKNKFYGTIKQTKSFKNKLISEKTTLDSDILMMQLPGVNLGSKLCEVYAQQQVKSFERKAINNPNYNPRPTEKDIDALIDKHTAPKAGAKK
jgi:hypothetical protein